MKALRLVKGLVLLVLHVTCLISLNLHVFPTVVVTDDTISTKTLINRDRSVVGNHSHQIAMQSATPLSLARNAASFFRRLRIALPLGRERLLVRDTRPLDYGFVYAAVGKGTIRKASVSASSLRSTMSDRMGTFLVTSELGLESLKPQALAHGKAFWWDIVASIDGFGINFTSLPEFEAFTSLPAKQKGGVKRDLASTVSWNRNKQKERSRSKPTLWSVVRQLRSAKVAALLLSLELFSIAVVFLDADTLVCDSFTVSSVFDMVSNMGPWFAFVPAPSEHHSPILKQKFGVLRSMAPPEPNTGVMAIAVCDGARRVVARWGEVYWHESLALGPIQNPMDQPPLRVALFLESASWITLKNILNCRGHVKYLNAALPMRCGGYDMNQWESIARSTILEAVGAMQHTSASLAFANRIMGGKGCMVLHSHAIPRFTYFHSSFQKNALIATDKSDARKRNLFGFGLEKLNTPFRALNTVRPKRPLIINRSNSFNVSVPEGLMAIFTLLPATNRTPARIDESVDWRRGDWRKMGVIVGSMARDACAIEPKPCAVILVLLDPLVRLAAMNDPIQNITGNSSEFSDLLHCRAKSWNRRGRTLLDALLPLNAADLEIFADPRATRVERYGPGNSAEVADAISRLETDNFLVLLAAEPRLSEQLLDITLKHRPEAAWMAHQALESAVRSDLKGRQAIRTLDTSSQNSLRQLLLHDSSIYFAAERLFSMQFDAAVGSPSRQF